MKKAFFVYVMLIFISLATNSICAQFYIASNGNDQNEGTFQKPLATLMGARNAIRNYKATNSIKKPITVIIADGNYTMTESFVLKPEDGGTAENPIIYKAADGARPVFSGGKKITGFKVNNEGLWETKIPECTYYNWRFDQLYVNGKRATMARTSNADFLKIDKVTQNIWEKGSGRVAEKAQQIIYFDSDNFSELNNISDEELPYVRFRAYHKWDFTIRFIDKMDKDSMRIFTSGKGMKPWNPLKKRGRIVIENFKAALDTPGEWYLNNHGTLYYKPRKGENIENALVIAPVLENLINVEGNATDNSLVEHIKFEGISFNYCHYKIPKSGSEPNQAAARLNAAIMLKGASNITFSNCEISNTGQHALWFRKGCSNSIIDQCYIHNLGGGGIYLGDFSPVEGIEHTANIKINNSIIQTGGQEFPSAVGIWVGHSSDNEITHNDIGNFYYSGISVGWIWGYAPSLAKRNKISYNNIHHIGWDLLSDMAAVYTLGKSEGTKINNNVIHHIHAYSYGGWGLYTDEGSSDILMENNLVYSTKTGGFHQHYGKNNTIRNNIFAFAKLYQAQCTRVEKHRSFNFENNILLFEEGVVLKGAWEKIDIYMDNNLYWNISSDSYDFNGKSFSEWQKFGHDKNSIVANPNFKDVKNFDFRLKNKKNSNHINFEPFDFNLAGVYGDKDWINKSKLSTEITNKFDEVVLNNMKKQTNRD